MDINFELDGFKKSLKNKSKNTIYNYCLDIKQFLIWLNDKSINDEVIEEYKSKLMKIIKLKL